MLPSFRTIFQRVLTVHIVLMLVAGVSFSWRSVPEPRKPIVVKSVNLKSTPTQQPIAKVAPKAEPKKPTQKKQEVALDEKKMELLAKAQQTISQIDLNRDTLTQKPKSKTVAKLSIDDDAPDQAGAGYVDKVAALLKALLKLPDKGEVNINLTLNRQGRVVELKVVNTKSTVNSIYIEKAVSEIAFPPFANEFTGENKHTFHITLSDI